MNSANLPLPQEKRKQKGKYLLLTCGFILEKKKKDTYAFLNKSHDCILADTYL